jgi:hypothetical protein
MLLAYDPGRDCGWAVFDEQGVYVRGGVRGVPDATGVRQAIIERPQVYRASRSKGDPNDLITLAIGVGRMQERLESKGVTVELVLPATWKGQIPKEVHHRRILEVLTATERTRLSASLSGIAPSIRHNLLDAVGLGLWFLRRGRR